GEYAFYNCSKVPNLPIPETVTSIGHYAFYNCSAAQFGEMKFSDKLTVIGTQAFDTCLGITAVDIPSSVRIIGNQAFARCANLKNAVIRDGVAEIQRYVFNECKSLETLTIPYAGKTLETANDGSAEPVYSWFFNSAYAPEGFYNANGHGIPAGLTKITVTGGSIIPDNSFSNMVSLEEIIYPDDITSIGEYAFYNCSKVPNLPIPETVTSIGHYAFYNCSAAQFGEMNFSDKLTFIGIEAFNNCLGITAVDIPSSVRIIGNQAFVRCANLKNAVIRDGVAEIQRYVFNECRSLETLTIPYAGNTLETANDGSAAPVYSWFFNSAYAPEGYYNANGHGIPAGLTSITVTGGSIIPADSFMNMSGLKTFVAPGTLETVQAGAFHGCNALSEAQILNADNNWDDVVIEEDNDPLLNLVRKHPVPGTTIPENVTTTTTETTTTTTETTTTTAKATTTTTKATTTTAKATTTTAKATTTTAKATTTTAKATTTTTKATTTTAKATTTTTKATTTTTKATTTTTKATTTTTESTTTESTTTESTTTEATTTEVTTTEATTTEATTTEVTTTETTAPVTTTPTQPTEPETPLEKGDPDGDGVVTMNDVITVLTFYVEEFIGLHPTLTDAQRNAADVDEDGKITLTDAQLVLVYYVSNTIAQLDIPWSYLIGRKKNLIRK
ncbi:MAG: leucine-rich repeat protein, partial [Oscillospiraceae bacterium]|nr:leucine-rich repeat protein [Oscillospiraceae bacterium]